MNQIESIQSATSPDGLAALLSRAGANERELPPVEKWDPSYCGEIDMRIARDGTWYYMGSPIGREALVNLFSTVLRKDLDGKHYLVTPVEKIGIQVEDAPFLAVEMHSKGQGEDQKITIRTKQGDVVEAGPENPMRFEKDEENDGLKPYILVRGRLEARFARPLLYELVKIMEKKFVYDVEMYGIWSSGEYYPMLPVDEVEPIS